MKVPLLDLTRQYQALKSELDSAVLSVCATQGFIMGPEVALFENQAAAYCKTKHALGVSSGTDALVLALMALNIGPGDEVITAPYSFFATAGSIARVGAKPVFVDIDPLSYNINTKLIETAITNRTKAIMPVHLFGQCAEMGDLMEIAKKHSLPVIEDAAQAIGSEWNGKRAGELGDVGCFSFFPSKNLGAFGDAGLVTANSSELFERLKMLRIHGSKVKYYHDEVGGNFRLDTLQAAVLSVKLPHLDSWSEKRVQNANKYFKLFAEADLISESVEKGKLVPPTALAGRRHIFNQFVIRVSERDRVMKELKENGIGCEVYYPLPLHLQQCFLPLGYKKGDFPVSELAAEQSLAIPIFPELTAAEIEQVVSALASSI